MSRFRNCCLVIAVSALSVPAAHAQPERFELGQRLRAFETAWDQVKDAAARKRAIEPLIQATSAFFSFRLSEAGRSLDAARFALHDEKPPPDERRWATALYAQVSRRLADAKSGVVKLNVKPFYDPSLPAPDKAVLIARLVSATNGQTLAEDKVTVEAGTPPAIAQWEMRLAWKDAPEGDHSLRLELLVDGKVLPVTVQTVSLAAHLSERLGELKKLPHEEAHRNIEGQTFGELRRLVQGLADGKTLETNYPAARLLAEAEAVPESIRKGEPYYAWPRAGQHWLRVVAGANKETVRIFIPEQLAKDRPVPLVIAMHGAGGSENLFFDGHGGAIVRLCKERGWILVAPRATPFSAPLRTENLIDELALRWPIDKKRVFVVGHSMGAMQALQAVRRIPTRVAGVAALAGGQKIDAEPLVDVPFFLGVGARDFLARSVRSLRDSLAEAEVKTVVYREYPDLEHLVIVQAALPDVFTFFDGIAKKTP